MTTRQEAVEAAGEVYGAILADPDEAARIQAARDRHEAEQANRKTAERKSA